MLAQTTSRSLSGAYLGKHKWLGKRRVCTRLPARAPPTPPLPWAGITLFLSSSLLNRVQKEQLAAIFKLMKDNKDTFGEMSDGDMQEQLRLYDM